MYMDFLKITNEEVKSISNDTSYRLCLYCNVGDTGRTYSAFFQATIFTYLNGQWWWVGYGVKVATRWFRQSYTTFSKKYELLYNIAQVRNILHFLKYFLLLI